MRTSIGRDPTRKPLSPGRDAPATASLLVDGQGRIAGWSQGACRLFGLVSFEVLGARWNEVLSCRDLHGRPIDLSAGDATSGAPRHVLVRDCHGQTLRVSLVLAMGPEDAAGHVLILLRNTAVGSSAMPQLDDVLDEALETTGAEIAEVFLRDSADAETVSFAGFRGPFRDAFEEIVHFSLGYGYAGIVTAYGRPLLSANAVDDDRLKRVRVKELGFRYYLCVPVPGRGGPAGSLQIASRSDPQTVLPHWLTLHRAAERLGLMIEREEHGGRPLTDWHRSDAARHVVEPVTAAALDVRCLGRFTLSRNGQPLDMSRFARRRALTVLKILLTHYGKVVPRDELIDALWPEGPPDDAPTLLKVAVHYLRRGLGGAGGGGEPVVSFISTEPDGYAFNVASPHRLDAHAFEVAVQEGIRLGRQGYRQAALSAFRAAAACYAGDFLEDEPYSDWCLERRRKLRETLVTVLRETAHLLRSGGEDEAAIETYRRLLGLEPYLEDVHCELMEILWRTGRRVEAIQQYEICAHALRNEIGVSPLPATEALFHRILRG